MIPVSKPIIAKNALKYLTECIESGWVSSLGSFVIKFEEKFAQFVNVKFAISTPNGTSALHLGMAALGIGEGDEIIVPAYTMIAACLPIIYLGAKPVLVDVDPKSGNIAPELIEKKISKKTKAIVVVHINGQPAQMSKIIRIAKKHKLLVIEDAAEAHGAKIKIGNTWKSVGSIGDIGCFSFYANKVITAGEGGMLVTNNKKLAENARSLRNLSRSKNKHFYHQQVGFTYRMSNLQAALGLAQLEQVNKITEIKKKIRDDYEKLLKRNQFLTLPIQDEENTKRLYWQVDLVIHKDSPVRRSELTKALDKNGIEFRTGMTPLHLQPAFRKVGLFKNEKYPNAEQLNKEILTLPSGPEVSHAEIQKVCEVINRQFDL